MKTLRCPKPKNNTNKSVKHYKTFTSNCCFSIFPLFSHCVVLPTYVYIIYIYKIDAARLFVHLLNDMYIAVCRNERRKIIKIAKVKHK